MSYALELLEFAKASEQTLAVALNQTLLWHPAWAKLWAILNHHHESWINVIAMVGTNLLLLAGQPKYAAQAPQRKLAFFRVIYFWLCFQLCIVLTQWIFQGGFHIHRLSPTLCLDNMNLLTSLTGLDNIKQISSNCFPSGHALVAVYWGLFTWPLTRTLQNNKLFWQAIVLLISFTLCTNRLFSGVHWISDVLMSSILASFYYFVAASLWPKPNKVQLARASFFS